MALYDVEALITFYFDDETEQDVTWRDTIVADGEDDARSKAQMSADTYASNERLSNSRIMTFEIKWVEVYQSRGVAAAAQPFKQTWFGMRNTALRVRWGFARVFRSR